MYLFHRGHFSVACAGIKPNLFTLGNVQLVRFREESFSLQTSHQVITQVRHMHQSSPPPSSKQAVGFYHSSRVLTSDPICKLKYTKCIFADTCRVAAIGLNIQGQMCFFPQCNLYGLYHFVQYFQQRWQKQHYPGEQYRRSGSHLYFHAYQIPDIVRGASHRS